MKKSTVVIIVVSAVAFFLIASVAVLSVLYMMVFKKTDNLPVQELTEYHTEYTEDVSSENIVESAEAEITEAKTEQVAENSDYLSTLSDNEIKMLNIFLSNFSEAFVENIDTSDMTKMIDFVCCNTKINYYENINSSEMIQNPENGEYYQDYLTEEYVAERVDRFFDVELENTSTDSCYYNDGKYYLIAAAGETYAYFTKITSATKNSDGTVTVDYNVYWYDIEYDTPPKRIYEGIGSENLDSLCNYRYSGTAVVRPAQLGGENYSKL